MFFSDMSSRERILAALHQEPVDRFPVWLKMAGSDWKNFQPEPYRSMAGEDLLAECGCDVMTHCGLRITRKSPHVDIESERIGDRITKTWRTPDGDLRGVDAVDPDTQSTHPIEFPIKTVADLAAFRWVYRDVTWDVSDEARKQSVERQQEVVSKDYVSTSSTGPSPYMELMQHLVGPENTVFFGLDEPELFEELLQLMHEVKVAQLDATLPYDRSDTFWLVENTSTTLLSPDYFRTYCVPHLKVYGQMVLDHGLIPVHHMCGLLDAILEDIDGLPAMVNEAYTTPPLGNTTLAAGRERMPSKALIGGTNATLWLEDADTIISTVAQDLENCCNTQGIFLTSAGVLPGPVSFEKAKAVVTGLKKLRV